MIEQHRLTTDELDDATRAALRALLDAAFGGEFSDDDWAHALGGVHVVLTDAGAVVAHAAVVPRRITIGGHPWHTGYVEGVATAPDRQGEGLGTIAMTAANDIVRAAYELGVLSTGEHHFYERVGWQRWQGPAYVLMGDGPVRTPDEDDGIMVLRVGPGAALDLTAAISCEQRAGDDW